jgi:nucleoside-diphosphate-sugar epimerase
VGACDSTIGHAYGARVRALVMGGNRYIGLHLVFELARQGHDVTIMNSHEAPMPEGARRIHADRRVPGAIVEALGPHRDEFDVVFDNTAYDVGDLEPMIELFRGNVEQLVFTSSVAVYKRSFIQPVTESHATHRPDDEDPRKAYGVGKVRSERYLLGMDDVHATSLRVTHTIGPKSPLVTREPIFYRRLELGRPILIPGDGFPFVHVVHVQDVARLMVSLIGNERAHGQIYNVAGSEITSVEGCIRLMARAVGVEPHIVHVPLDVARRARPPLVHWGEAMVGGAIVSIDKALADLDWTPSFGLEDGYADSYAWYDREGRDLFEYDFSGDDAVLEQLVGS